MERRRRTQTRAAIFRLARLAASRCCRGPQTPVCAPLRLMSGRRREEREREFIWNETTVPVQLCVYPCVCPSGSGWCASCERARTPACSHTCSARLALGCAHGAPPTRVYRKRSTPSCNTHHLLAPFGVQMPYHQWNPHSSSGYLRYPLGGWIRAVA
jgi:hypothetical protein